MIASFSETRVRRLDGRQLNSNRSNMNIVNDAINFTRDWLVIT